MNWYHKVKVALFGKLDFQNGVLKNSKIKIMNFKLKIKSYCNKMLKLRQIFKKIMIKL